jgi:hypothetical protein
VEGATLTVIGGAGTLTLMAALAETLASAAEVAVRVTVEGLGAFAGAV